MKELDYDHSVFSTELIDLGHYGYKGLLTSQRERWMDVKCFQIKKALPPAWGVRGLNLNVIKRPVPNASLQDIEKGEGQVIWLHRDAISKSLRNSIIQTNNLGCSTDCKGRNIDGEEATG